MSLFEPFSAGRFHAKNHFIRAAAKEELCSDEGHIPEQCYELYEKLAAGGVGTIITGSMRVRLFEGTVPSGLYRLDKPELLDEYARLAKIGKENNVTMIAQATYSHKDINALSKQELENIVSEYIQAALFAQRAGFDGIQIHEAHEMFLDDVLSKKINHRRDEYGKNPSLLSVKIIKGIRSVCDEGFIIINKIDSQNEHLSKEESLDHCLQIEKAGCDLIEVSGFPAILKGEGQSYFKDFALDLSRKVNIPISLVGGNRDLVLLEELHEQGIDCFSLCRPLTNEFDLIHRWQSGDRQKAKCRFCNGCLKTYGHFCPFNSHSPKKPTRFHNI